MKATCLNCGCEFELKKIYHDELGTFTVCPECDGSFDIDVNNNDNDLLEDLLLEQQGLM